MSGWDGHWRGPSLADVRTVTDEANVERVFAHSGYFQLSRPAIIDSADLSSITHDVAVIMNALIKLPHVLGDGDILRYFGFLGYDKAKQDLISVGHRVNMFGQLGRCDLFRDESGFKVLEVNASSAAGALDSRVLADAYFCNPRFRCYVDELNLRWTDPAERLAGRLRGMLPEIKTGPLAILDSPHSYRVSKHVHDGLAKILVSHGIECFSGSLGDVVVRKGKATCLGRPFSVAYRAFQARELMSTSEETVRWTLLLSELDAAAIPMIVPPSSTCLSDKRSLALLQSGEVWPHLTLNEKNAISKVLPRSAIIGTRYSRRCYEHLEAWLRRERHEIVLKPAIGSSSKGIVFGRDVCQETWENLLTNPPPGGYVAQKVIDPVPELCPEGDGSESAWTIQIGAFYLWGDVVVASARGMRAGVKGPIRSLYRGADSPSKYAALGSLTLVAP